MRISRGARAAALIAAAVALAALLVTGALALTLGPVDTGGAA